MALLKVSVSMRSVYLQNMLLRAVGTVTVALALLIAPQDQVRAGPLVYKQTPNPFEAVEDTTGNIGFLNITNPGFPVTITGISFGALLSTGGESDDQVTNFKLVAPQPTVESPLQIALGGSANLRFSWDAIDLVHDNDIDFGSWSMTMTVDYTVLAEDIPYHDLVFIDLKVDDPTLHVPEPASATLFGIGTFFLAFVPRRKPSARRNRADK